MSDVPQGPGWWQASDGRWYPPEQFHGSTSGAVPPDGPAPTPDLGAPAWGGPPPGSAAPGGFAAPDAHGAFPGGPPPPAYPPYPPGQGSWGYGVPLGYVAPKTEGMAIASLVLAIIGVPLCGCLIFEVLAIVFGFLARKKIRESNGALTGDGLAIAGLAIGVVMLIVAIGYWIFALTSSTTTTRLR